MKFFFRCDWWSSWLGYSANTFNVKGLAIRCKTKWVSQQNQQWIQWNHPNDIINLENTGADASSHLTSVERVLEYSQLEAEEQQQRPTNVAEDWPHKGKIEFKNVSYRYSTESKPVLRGLSFSIKPREKVSVVGRTGAGKSSLISALFRLALVEGDIVIDNINTSTIPLATLRSRISIIPQEPTLFSGTLRRYAALANCDHVTK